MKRNRPLVLTVLALTAALLACTLPLEFQPFLPPTPAPSPDIQAAVAQTLTAIALFNPAATPTAADMQAAIAQTLTALAPPQSTASPFPSATPSLTPTPLPLFSATPGTLLVSVSVPTNCRSGPGKVYDYVGALLVGETTEVVGWEGQGEYWYVRNPDEAGSFCWIWGKYATLSGSPAGLPVLTPPPTPTPSPNFSIVSVRVDKCVGWYVSVKVKNTGTQAFESISIKVYDPAKDKTIGSAVYDSFEAWQGCIGGAPMPTLDSGETGYVQSNDFAYDPSGHNLKITVTLCTADGGGGTCVSRSKTVKP
jgi:hypothetical protein